MTVWRRSQKIVCVQHHFPSIEEDGSSSGQMPIVGKVYTIWDICPHPDIPDRVGFQLEEFLPSIWVYGEVGFRPAVDRPTDISVFTKALLPATPNLDPVSCS